VHDTGFAAGTNRLDTANVYGRCAAKSIGPGGCASVD